MELGNMPKDNYVLTIFLSGLSEHPDTLSQVMWALGQRTESIS